MHFAVAGLPPFFSSKYDLKQPPNYKYTAKSDKKKNVFDLDNPSIATGGLSLTRLVRCTRETYPKPGFVSEDEDILNYDDEDDPDAYA